MFGLVPALQANRILGLHVTTMLLSYSALSISFGAALLYLLQADGSGRCSATRLLLESAITARDQRDRSRE
jgi:ABC-type transport system involved in cytochrome c biogenesis permease subunit